MGKSHRASPNIVVFRHPGLSCLNLALMSAFNDGAQTPKKSPKNASRPGRTLAILAIILIAFTGLAFIQGATSVKLGLDLRGGTSLTLKPVQSQGGKIDNAAISQAVSIIRQRVNSFGVSEAQVTAQGNGANSTIVISVPGKTGQDLVNTVGQTAQLRFRQVLAVGAPAAKSAAISTGTVSETSTATSKKSAVKLPSQVKSYPVGVDATLDAQFAALDCTKAASRQGGSIDDPNAKIVACDQTGQAKYILGAAEVVGQDVKTAQAAIDQQGSQGWYILLSFTGNGAKKFGAFTSRVTSLASPQNQGAIVLDGLVVSAPTIQQAITTGNAQITGSFNQSSASTLANQLKYGALPLTFTRDAVEQVSPTLGSDQLRAGILAGVIGLLLVILYSVLYYRGLGIVSVGSLLVAGAITFLSFLLLGKGIGFTLTLAGIAGAIVSIGITADSFIVYFERLRDEVREGKSLRTAIETGWVRARRTILVADFVSLIASILLYYFTVASVRGFAFTLGLTTAVDLIVVFFFTKPLLTLLSKVNFYSQGHRFSGLSPRSLGVVEGSHTQTLSDSHKEVQS
jgi:preprotein translocase subunit SecD